MTGKFQIGAVLDRYEIEGFLGEGAMGVVYRARHRALGTRHAIKVLRVHTDELARRMLEEARQQGSIRHPNVVAVTDFLDLDGAPAIVQDLVDGPSLEVLLRGDKLPLERVDQLARGILKGVHAAHASGLVHRDIKPANVLVDQTGPEWVPRLTDFGLVKAVAPEGGERLTVTGTAMGTPGYMAPEQFEDAASVDSRADLFSVGVVLYEMITGERPFRGGGILQVARATSKGEYTEPNVLRAELPERMSKAMEGALCTLPGHRIPNADLLLRCWDGTAEHTPDRTPKTWIYNPAEEQGAAPETKEPSERWTVGSDPSMSSSGDKQEFGRFFLEELLGEGGGGQVYRATMQGPVGFRKQVALKILRPGSLVGQALDDLINEARLGGLLKHPNIVEVYDLGQHEEQFYVAMEWVRGQSLRHRLRESQALPFDRVVAIGVQVCAGLEHAHELVDGKRRVGLVHRDLKPSNLLVERDGRVKIADFGIATLQEVENQGGRSVLVRGTPGYMAPEQLSGEEEWIGPATDLFALSVVLGELLTGVSPKPANGGVVAVRAALRDSEAPEALVAILKKGMQLDPSERYGSATVFREALESLMSDGAGVSAAKSNGVPTELPSQSTLYPMADEVADAESREAPHPLISGMIAVALAVPILGGLLTLMFGSVGDVFGMGGFFVYPIVGLVLVNVGLLPLLWQKVREGQPVNPVFWLSFPSLIRVLGSVSTMLGLQQARHAVLGADIQDIPLMASSALWVVLMTEVLSLVCAGLLGGATLLVGAMAMGRPRIKIAQWSLVGALGLAGIGWIGGAFARSLEPLALLPAGPYLAALGLVFSLVLLAIVVDKSNLRPMSGLLIILVFSSLWVSDTTTMGVMLLELRGIFEGTAQAENQDWLQMSATFDYLASQGYWMEAVVWFTVFALGSMAVLIVLQRRPFQPRALEGFDGLIAGLVVGVGAAVAAMGWLDIAVVAYLCLGLGLSAVGMELFLRPRLSGPKVFGLMAWMVLGLFTWAAGDKVRVDMADAIRPGFHNASAMVLLGTGISDLPANHPWTSQGAQVVDSVGALQADDVIQTMNGRPVKDTEDLLTQIALCACEQGDFEHCWLEACLSTESTVEFGVLRGEEDGARPQLISVTSALWPPEANREAEGPSMLAPSPDAVSPRDLEVYLEARSAVLAGELNRGQRLLRPLLERYPDNPDVLFFHLMTNLFRNRELDFYKDFGRLKTLVEPETLVGRIVEVLDRRITNAEQSLMEEWDAVFRDHSDPMLELIHLVFLPLIYGDQLETTMPLFDAAVERWPDLVLMHVGRVGTFQVMDQMVAADQALNEGLERLPDATMLQLFRIQQWNNLGQYEEASRLAQQSLAVDPGEVRLHELLAASLVHLGDKRALEEQVRVMLGPTTADEDKVQLLLNVIRTLRQTGRPLEGMAWLEQCVELAMGIDSYVAAGGCSRQGVRGALIVEDLDAARSWRVRMKEFFQAPELVGKEARSANVSVLVFDALIAALEGESKAVETTQRRLMEIPDSVYGNLPGFKEQVIKRLEYWRMAGAGDVEGMRNAIANFPEGGLRVGTSRLGGSQGCLADWLRVEVVKRESDQAALDTTTSLLLSRGECTNGEDNVLRSQSLIHLAEAQVNAGNPEAARSLLEQEAKEWPFAEVAVPGQRLALVLHEQLGLQGIKGRTQPMLSTATQPLVTQLRPCDAQEAEECSGEMRSWCDPDEGQVACCANGLVATDAKAGLCDCPPGGTSVAAMAEQGCSLGDADAFQEAVQEKMASQRSRIEECYVRALGSGKRLSGKVTVGFDLGANGRPIQSKVLAASLPSSPVQACILEAMHEMQWPLPVDGYTKIRYPFVFDSEK